MEKVRDEMDGGNGAEQTTYIFLGLQVLEHALHATVAGIVEGVQPVPQGVVFGEEVPKKISALGQYVIEKERHGKRGTY